MFKQLARTRISLQLKLIIPFIFIIILIIGVLLPFTNSLIAERFEEESTRRLNQEVDTVTALMVASEEQALLGARFIANQFDVQIAISVGTETAIGPAMISARQALEVQEASVYAADFSPGDLPLYYGGPITSRRFQASEEAAVIRDELIQSVIATGQPESRIIITPQSSQIVGAAPVPAPGTMDSSSAIGVVLTSILIDESYVQNLSQVVGVDVALVKDNKVIGSTIDPATGYELVLQEGFTTSLVAPRTTSLDSPTGIPVRLLADRLFLDGRDLGAVLVAQSASDLQGVQRDISLVLGIFAGILILATSITGVAVLLNIAQPIARIADAARKVSEGDLAQRVQPPAFTRDEVTDLSDSFNVMTERLSDLYENLETQVEERTVELAIARDQALEASKTKSAFLATMSHELRTPLNSVIGYSQMMSRGMSGDLNEKQVDYVERILRNGRHLLALINDVLDIAKIEAGRMELLNKPFEVMELFEGVKQENLILAQNKGLDFRIDIGDEMPSLVVGDPARIKQIAINLISNAIKFTEEGHVHVFVRNLNSETWEISVSDTGAGIPSHMQEVIFDEFRQVDQTARREHGGTGLGLAIVRNLCMMMGGTVRVTSTLGVGSTFAVRLPLEVPEPEKV